MELRDYLMILHKSWILIVACALLGVAAAAAFSITVTPKYDAKTKLYVSVQATDTTATGDLVQRSSFAQKAVTSYVDIVGSARVLNPVIDDLQLPMTASILAETVTASSPLDTVLIEITVTNVNPQQAADIADSVGESFRTVVDDLEKPAGGGDSRVKIETIQPALAPSPRPAPRFL